MLSADALETRAIIRRVLTREANALATGRRLPIDLNGLASELGISIVVESIRANGLLRNERGRWQIVVRADTLPVRRRFTVAHELGHYVIESRLDFRPVTSREYWMLEEECQSFAAALLMPALVVEGAIGGAAGPTALIDAVRRLGATAGVAIEAAARRIVEQVSIPTVVAVIDLDGGGSATSSGSVSWLHGSAGTVSVGRGRRIRARDHLAPLVVAAQAMTTGDQTDIETESGPAVLLRQPDSTVLAVITPWRRVQSAEAAA